MASDLIARRTFLAGLGAAALAPAVVKAATPPNFLLIMADDLGKQGLSFYGDPRYSTPNLDALAATGRVYTRCYTPSICTQTRVQLMTGLYPTTTRWLWGMWHFPPEEQRVDPALGTFGQYFQAHGYRTCVADKWQLGRFDRWPDHPHEMGFDEWCLWDGGYNKPSQSRYWHPYFWQDGAELPTAPDDFGPDISADFLKSFIAKTLSPWLAYWPLNLPHVPYVETPDNTLEPGADPSSLLPGMIAYMDKIIGEVVAGLPENTYVIFLGDNGSPKGSPKESGINVPLIINGPGFSGTSHQLVDTADLYPTMAELAGMPPPFVEGQPVSQVRDYSHVAFNVKRKGETKRYRIIGDGRWKLWGENRLYDLLNDPKERSPIWPKADTALSLDARERLIHSRMALP